MKIRIIQMENIFFLYSWMMRLLILCTSIVVAASTAKASGDERPASPPDTSGKNWTGFAIAGSLAFTAILLKTDQRTSDGLYAWKREHHFAGEFSRVVTHLGDGRPSIAFFGGALAYSLVFNDKKSMQLGKIGLESFALSGVASQLLKQIFSRQQPNVSTRDGGAFYGPFAYFRQEGSLRHGMSFYDALPSGHTATVFAAATTISDFYTEPWVSYASYTIASVAGISRITERMHWASDIFVGALLGYYSTKIVEKLNYDAEDFSLSPQAGDNSIGVMLSVKL
jgi:hypothetical protein